MFLPRRSAKYPFVISFTLQEEKIHNLITNSTMTSSYIAGSNFNMPQKVNIYISLLSSFLASFPIFFSTLSSWMAAVFVMRRLWPIIKVGHDFSNILLKIPAILNFGQQHFLPVLIYSLRHVLIISSLEPWNPGTPEHLNTWTPRNTKNNKVSGNRVLKTAWSVQFISQDIGDWI